MIRLRYRNGERGAAAVEFALFLGLLVTLLAFFGPLAQAFMTQIKLSRAAGRTIRFATMVPERPTPGKTGRRPSVSEVVLEAHKAYFGDSEVDGTLSPALSVSVDPSPRDAGAGEQVEVVLSTTVDLGVIGRLFGRDSLDLTASAVSLEE